MKGYNTTHRRRLEAGQCIGCGHQDLATRRHCKACARVRNQAASARYHRKKAA